MESEKSKKVKENHKHKNIYKKTPFPFYEIKQVLIKNFNKFLKEKYFNPGNNQVQQPIPGKVDPSDSIETTDSETNDDTDRFSYFSNKLKIFAYILTCTRTKDALMSVLTKIERILGFLVPFLGFFKNS